MIRILILKFLQRKRQKEEAVPGEGEAEETPSVNTNQGAQVEKHMLPHCKFWFCASRAGVVFSICNTCSM